MEIDSLLKTIQDSCNDFIKHNSENVMKKLEENTTTLGLDLSQVQIDYIKPNSWGVYVFYINPKVPISSYDDLCRFWLTDSQENPLKSPRPIKGRFSALECGENRCFYVGKSENLKGRISQHIHQITAPSTYGLKLSAHDRLHGNNTFSYSYFTFKENPDVKYKDAMKCLLVTLESHLRNKLKPIIGKQ